MIQHIESQALADIDASLKGMSLDTALNEKGEGADQFKAKVATLIAPIPKDHVGGITKAVSKFRGEVRKLAKKQNKKSKAADGAQESQKSPLHKMVCEVADTLDPGESIGLTLTRAEFNAGRGTFISAMDVKPFRELQDARHGTYHVLNT